MHDRPLPPADLARLRAERDALLREVDRLNDALADAGRSAARQDAAREADELAQAGRLAASEARSIAAEVDARAAWARAGELGTALGRRIAEGQARLIASQAALASLEHANQGLAAGRAEIALREADLRSVIESAIDCAIITTDGDGVVLAWNSGARRLLGWEEGRALSMDLGSVLPEEERAAGRLGADIAAALSGRRVAREGWLLRQGGGRVWAAIEAMALRPDGADQPAGVLWMLRDRSLARRAEERLQRVLETDAVGVLFFDAEGTLIGANDAFLRMTGHAREAVASGALTWQRMTPPEWMAESERQIARLAATGRIGPYEKEYFVADGSRRWMIFAGRDLGDGSIVEFCIDVTERRRAEAALREQETKYRTLFESIDEAFCIVEVLFDGAGRAEDYRFLEVNPAFERHTGIADAAGRRLRELVPDQDRRWIETYGRIAQDGGPERFSSFSEALGRWYDVCAFRVGEPGGNRVAILFKDITARRHAEETLRASEERGAFLLRLSDALRPILDPVEAQRVAMRMLGEFLGVDLAFYYHAEWTDAGWVHAVDHDFAWRHGQPGRTGRRAQAEFGAELYAGLARGEPVMASDVAALDSLTPAQRANYDAIPVRAFVVVPLLKEGRYVAGVSIGSAEPRAWSAGEVALVTEVAERTWAAAERARAEAALRASEALFRGFAENSADVLWIVSGDGATLEYLSPAFERTFGEPREGILADLGRFEALVHPEDRAQVRDYLPRTLAGESAVAHYRVIRPSDGRVVHLRDTGFPIRDDAGRIARVAGIVQDITELHEAAAAREAEKERFRSLAEGMPQLVWRSAGAGRWTWAGPQWTAYTGLPDAASRDLGWLAAVHPEDRAGAIAAWALATQAGRPYEADFRLRRAADGAWRWFRSRGAPVRDDRGWILEWVGTSTDIDDQMQARESLTRTGEELERRVAERTAELMAAEETLRQAQKLEAIGQLTGGIAHDFNNMLQGVAGGLDMARRRMEAGRLQEAARYLDAARDATGRAAGLTRRLLAFARRQRLEPRPIDPDALVHGLEEMLRRTIGPTVALELDLADGCGFVACDPNELESALLNLCINARDAMPEGGRLVVSTRDRVLSAADLDGASDVVPGPFVEIAVADTGNGMPPELLARVLEPFFTTKPLGRGTGLGLSQVYGFVRQSGGAMRIESSPGRGTTVRLWLPHSPRRAAAAGEGPPDSAASPGGASGGATLLLVDDESGVREPAAARLRDLGYVVVEASDGQAALRLLQDGLRPDLLVTDVGLPGGLDGVRVAEAAQRLVLQLPVLFMTGYATTALPLDAAVIGKPFALDALTARVRGALRAAVQPAGR